LTIGQGAFNLQRVTLKQVPPAAEDSSAVRRISRSSVTILLLLTSVAVARVLATYTTFNQTYDEPFHIAAGMEWLEKGTYTSELQHPPLARVAVALGPYLSGLRWPGSPITNPDWRGVGTVILTAHGNYLRNLTLARIGTLPFLVLACVVVFLWAHRWFGKVAAMFALLLFGSLPPILGHAGQATTDMAVAATVAAGLYMFVRWLEQPDGLRTGLLGIAFGAAVASKFSAIAFLPACVGVAAVYLAIVNRRLLLVRPLRWKRHVFRFLLAMLMALTFVWGTYRFSVRPLSPLQGAHRRIDQWMNDSWLRRAAYRAVETPLPLLEVYDGVQAVRIHDEIGHDSYLLGEYRKTGWWYYFPVVLAVKTPIGFLLLCAGGLAAAFLKSAAGSWQRHLTAIFPIVILLVCMPSRINIGVRHILAIYPSLAVLGGYGAARLVKDRRRWVPALGLLLVIWAVADSVAAHPDYLAYFNPIASAHPENVLCETDLDWGQDLFRLGGRLRALGVTRITIRYYGTAPLEAAGLPPHEELSPTVPASGYVAISVRDLKLEQAKDGSFDWLKRYQPFERVGRSIFLYDLP
jgi:dolichyl-phosphate-mannose-protein mannosyltransferase